MNEIELQARIDELERKLSNNRPWWAPDAQGFVIFAIIVYVGTALMYRMTHPVDVNDKLLDMMLTILFGTAFVGIVNYLIGTSRSSQAKDENRDKVVEKLMSGTGPGTLPTGPATMAAARTAAAEVAPAAAATAAPPAADASAPPAAEAAAPAAAAKAVAEFEERKDNPHV